MSRWLHLLLITIIVSTLTACTARSNDIPLSTQPVEEDLNQSESLGKIDDLTETDSPIEPINGNLNQQPNQGQTNNNKPNKMNNQAQVQLKSPQELLKLEQGQQLSAVLKTNQGDITVELYPDLAPQTVANFVGLSEGTQPWLDPSTGQVVENRPLYSNVAFHRIIENFMIQGGDPLGLGTGGPGYRFADETDSSLTFSEPGMLAMANSGPGTNGSQFFITVAATDWLNGKHTIFGKVIDGMDLVYQLSSVETDGRDRPVNPVILESVEIIRQ